MFVDCLVSVLGEEFGFVFIFLFLVRFRVIGFCIDIFFNFLIRDVFY